MYWEDYILRLLTIFLLLLILLVILIIPYSIYASIKGNQYKCDLLGDNGQWDFYAGCMVYDEKTESWITYGKWENTQGTFEIKE